MERSTRFKYNLTFEYAMQDLLGRKRYDGMAGGFRDPDFCKECMLKAIRRIRKRLSEIATMDERLREVTGIILDRLVRNVKETSRDINDDWIIIAHLLDLIAHLLGYDWLDGKIHRHVVYYQDKRQEQLDWKIKEVTRYYGEWRLENKRRYMLVNFLRKNNIPKYQIAKLLGITVLRVNRILLGIREYEKEKGESFPSFK